MTYTEKGDLMIKFLGFEHTAVVEYWTALERKQLDLCDIIFMNFEQTLYRGAKKWWRFIIKLSVQIISLQ